MKILLVVSIIFLKCFGYEIVIDKTEKFELQTKDTNIRNDGDNIVYDILTGLLWQDNSEAKSIKRDYKAADEYCKQLRLAGFKDWTLPTISQLESIADYSKRNPAMKNGFKNVYWGFYWSSSPCIETSKSIKDGKVRQLSYKDRQYGKENQGRNAWSVSFSDGSSNNQIRKTSKRNIRCVRKAE